MEIERPSLRTLVGKNNLVGAEIGIRWGKNAKNILTILDISVLYLIDPYLPYPTGNVPERIKYLVEHEQEKVFSTAKNNLKEYEDKIIWIRGFSWDVVDKIPELDFVYIDGDHRLESVRRDLELYYPKVVTGGLVSGHDYIIVNIEVDRFFNSNVIKNFENDWWIIKSEPAIDLVRREYTND